MSRGEGTRALHQLFVLRVLCVFLYQVRLVTEADVACGRYTLADVLLPIPGTCVALPTHGARESLVQWLARDGLQLDAFAATARIKSVLVVVGFS